MNWEDLETKLKVKNINNDHIKILRKLYRKAPPENLEKLQPEELAAHMKRGWDFYYGYRGKGIEVKEGEAAEILGVVEGKSTGPKPSISKVSLEEVGNAVGLKDRALYDLKLKRITEIKDIFSPKGLKAIKRLGITEQEQNYFIAVAKFTAISNNLNIAKKLVDKEITSFGKLGRMPRKKVEKLFGDLSDEERTEAYTLYGKAVIINSYLANASIVHGKSKRWDKNWYEPKGKNEPTESLGKEDPSDICSECDNCHNVFSPFAYVLDLIDFIYDNWNISSDTLEKIMLQEIDSLNCVGGFKPVRQINIAIEVLEKYLGSSRIPITDFDWVEKYGNTCEKLLQLVDKTKESLEEAIYDRSISDEDKILYETATSQLPRFSLLDNFVNNIHEINKSKIELKNPFPPEPGDESESEQLKYLFDYEKIKAERNRLKKEFEEKISLIISPVLIFYREKLIEATAEKDVDLENKLLIDLRNGPCQITNKITQLIQSLQSFVLSTRTGEVREIDRISELIDYNVFHFEEFDEATWNWLRNYQTWSSAMYVFVYPENVLSPRLRKQMALAFKEISESPKSVYNNIEYLLEYFESWHYLCADWIGSSIEWGLGENNRYFVVNLDEDNREEIIVTNSRDVQIRLLREDNGTLIADQISERVIKSQDGGSYWYLNQDDDFIVADFDGDGKEEIMVISPYGTTVGLLRKNNSELVLDSKYENLIYYNEDQTNGWGLNYGDEFIILNIEGNTKIVVVSSGNRNNIGDPRRKIGLLEWKNSKFEAIEDSISESVIGYPNSPIGWYLGKEDIFLVADIDGDNKEEIIIINPRGKQIGLLRESDGKLVAVKDSISTKWINPPGKTGKTGWKLNYGDKFIVADINGDNKKEIVVISPDGKWFGLLHVSNGKIVIDSLTHNWINHFGETGENGWELSNGDSFHVADVDGDNKEEIIVISPDGKRVGLIYERNNKLFAAKGISNDWINYFGENNEGGWKLNSGDIFLFADINGDNSNEVVVISPDGKDIGLLREVNTYGEYFEEHYLHLPLLAAWTLNSEGNYPVSHEWYRKLYDPFAPYNERQKFPFDSYFSGGFERPEEWLSDPLNLHAIAHKREGVYLRHVILSMVKNLLDWADHEFTLANPESINRARELYLLAERILQAPEFENNCENWIGEIEIKIIEKYKNWNFKSALRISELNKINSQNIISQVQDKIHEIFELKKSPVEAYKLINQVVDEALEKERIRRSDSTINMVYKNIHKKREEFENSIPGVWEPPELGPFDFSIPALPSFYSTVFCIPSNLLLKSLSNRIETNLFKLRICLTIDGEPANISQLPLGGAEYEIYSDINQLPTPATQFISASCYRYSYLIEKARQQAGFAQQLETVLLTAIEKKDQTTYDILNAENALEIAGSNVELKGLIVTEAGHAKDVANDQFLKAQRTQLFWDERTKAGFMGLSAAETAGLGLLATSGAIQALMVLPQFALTTLGAEATMAGVAADLTVEGAVIGVPLNIGGILATSVGIVTGGEQMANALQTFGNLSLTFAGFERRWEEWKLQKDLSVYDINIANHQVTLSIDRVNIVNKEKIISEIQQRQANDILEFLKNEKVANEILYEWMIIILKENYRKVMQIAASTAKRAQFALEFEKQKSLHYIQGDYWTISESSFTETQNDLGLLGAERLLTDLTHLEQFKLKEDKRLLQINKTISLAQMLPTDFIKFKKTGKIEFYSLMDWFDWDFPGHYMRLIKNVKVTVIALVPPTEGIHAMLTNEGVSSVVVNENYSFNSKRSMRTFNETIAIDSPYNDTGLFVLDYHDPMLLPFEGLGVDTKWTFEMPRATNRFNFDTIIDVQFTVEYTSQYDENYKDQVIQRLGNTYSTDIVLDMRLNYPDQWYHLKNPEDPSEEQKVVINIPRSTLSPNLKNKLDMKHFTVVVVGDGGINLSGVILKKKCNSEISVDIQTDERGLFSTRNPGSNNPFQTNLVNPAGEWEIHLDSEIYADNNGERKIDKINDIIFVLTIEGQINWGDTEKNITTLNDKSTNGPALATKQNILLLGWTGNGNNQLNFLSSDNGRTFSNKKILSKKSIDAMALTVFNDKFVVAWAEDGTGGVNLMQSDDGQQWPDESNIISETSDSSPALAVFKDKLYIAWRDKNNNKLNIKQSSDGTNWVDKNTLEDTTSSAPSLVRLGDSLLLAWRDNANNAVNIMQSSDGTSFTDKVTLPISTSSKPHLHVHACLAYITWEWTDSDQNKSLNILQSVDGKKWTNKVTFNQECIGGPVLGTLGSDLLLSFTGTDKKLRTLFYDWRE